MNQRPEILMTREQIEQRFAIDGEALATLPSVTICDVKRYDVTSLMTGGRQFARVISAGVEHAVIKDD